MKPMELTLRAKKLGVLIRDARKVSCRSMEECAEILGITPQAFEEFELGGHSPSLPQLELLAFYLKIPLEHFWSNQLLPPEEDVLEKLELNLLLGLRQRMIGAVLRKRRREKGLSTAEFAEKVGIKEDLLERYELGRQAIPFAELDMIAGALGFHVRDFQDRNGPVGSWFVQQRAMQDFHDLAPDLREFVAKPVNQPYIELAKRLSELNVEKLRTVAETLLEITF